MLKTQKKVATDNILRIRYGKGKRKRIVVTGWRWVGGVGRRESDALFPG